MIIPRSLRTAFESEKKDRLAEEDRVRRQRLERIQSVNTLVKWGGERFSLDVEKIDSPGSGEECVLARAFASDCKRILEECEWDGEKVKPILDAMWKPVRGENLESMFLHTS